MFIIKRKIKIIYKQDYPRLPFFVQLYQPQVFYFIWMDGCHRPWLDNQMATFLRSLTLSTVTSERAHEEQTANKSHQKCQTLKGFS